VSPFEFINGAAVLAAIALAYRTEARITRLETLIDQLIRRS
jgi:hypothetical protein